MLRPEHDLSLDEHVSALVWTPAVETAVLATLDGCVQALAVASGARPRMLVQHPGGALAVDISRNGLVASGGQDGRLRVVRLADARLITECHLGRWVEHVRWSPSGDRLAAAAGRKVCFWTSRGTPRGEIDAHTGTVTAMWWDRSGRSLTTACPDGLRLLRPDRRRTVHIPWNHAGTVLDAVESPDERYIAMNHLGGTVSVLQVNSSRAIQFGGFSGKVRKLAWSPDARRLAVAGGERVAVFGFTPRAPDRNRARMLRGHAGRVVALTFLATPRGVLLASGCDGGRLLLWSQARDMRRVGALQLDVPIKDLFASPDGRRLAVTGPGGRLRTFSLDM